MAQQTGEVCGNCHQLAQTYRYQVMVLERTKVRTVAMQTCGVCAHNLIDVLESMSGKPAEVFDASEGIRSAQKGGKGSAGNRPQARDRLDATGNRSPAST